MAQPICSRFPGIAIKEWQQTGVLGSLRRASKHWRGSDKSLAAIYLAQSGLGKLDEEGAYRLSLAAELIDAGLTPRELAGELGLRLARPDLEKAGYDLNEARVLAGHQGGGDWTDGGASASAPTTGGSAGARCDPARIKGLLTKR